MDNATNPDLTPVAPLEDQLLASEASEAISIYTPFQIRLASFIGGPFAAVYTIFRNFKQLNNAGGCKGTLLFGSLFIVVLISSLFVLPDKFPRIIIPLIYAYAAEYIAKSKQLTKQQIMDSSVYQRYSSLNVTAVIILSFLGFCIIVFPLFFLLAYMGIINLA